MNTNTLIAAARFFSLAETAAANGGFWVSAAGGTANVVAGEIARRAMKLNEEVIYEQQRNYISATGRRVCVE